MKIRNGFVSNSSSSSFIVVWDKQPESAEEIRKILFGDAKYHTAYNDDVSTELMSETIFKETKKASLEDINDEQSQLFYFDTYTGWDNQEPHWESVGYKPNEDLMDKYAEEKIKLKVMDDECRKILDKYSREERTRIQRKFKLERILEDGEELTDSEKLFINTEEKWNEIRQKMWSENETWEQLIEESTTALVEDHKDNFIAIYEFSDNDGTLYSTLEHGDVFDNLTHWRISKH